MKALLSVYDKTGLVEIASSLVELGIELVASGGTSRVLEGNSIEHEKVESVTGSPEMFDGRVKTLHPNIHGAILADRSKERHLADLERLGVDPIDIVVSNLYPFSSNPSIELIDIGGPAMVRGAAKNYHFVTILVDPSDYKVVIEEIASLGSTTLTTRAKLAAKAFHHTAVYDLAVANWMDGEASPEADLIGRGFGVTSMSLSPISPLRYGENPHQSGQLLQGPNGSIWTKAEWLSGPEPSYLNIWDADAAWRLVHEVSEGPAVVIVKHANPCGVSVAETLSLAYQRAFECDPISAFGGIVAFNGEVDAALAAEILAKPKADVIIAPAFSDGVVEALRERRKNLRVLQLSPPSRPAFQLRSVGDAFLLQDFDQVEDISGLESVTNRALSEQEVDDLKLAWTVCARTSSNAIVVVKEGQAVGIGCGQQNRLDSARIAVEKAGSAVVGAVASSDAFFPFPDGLETLAMAGITAIIAPSGSIRDSEILARAQELGISYVFASKRHFRH